MLSIEYIRQNKKKVEEAAKNKGYRIDIDKLLRHDEERKKTIQKVQKLREDRNKLIRRPASDEKIKLQSIKIRKELQILEGKLNETKKEFNTLLYQIPNLPADDVPFGKDEKENVVVKKWGEPKKFSFSPKNHLELGEPLDIIDIKRAVKISDTRFGYLKNAGALLEFALVQLALQTLTAEEFAPIIPPVLVKKEITAGLGYWQAGGHDDYFETKQDGLYLIGTAEHSIVPMHKDETFNRQELPRRYVGFSTCFRREAGSYGKDVRGIFRVHQFDKVEMVSFTTVEEDDKEHEYLLSMEEKLFQMLNIPYRVVKMCTGDLGFPTARKYDIEAWIPSQEKYREVTSVSTTADFQARRFNIKYQDSQQRKFVHILNGTAFAIGRTIIAILENYQQKDGSISIPKALQPYVRFNTIKKT